MKSKFYTIKSDSDDNNGFESDASGIKEWKRYAKPDEELQKDILFLFKDRDEWTMGEIKA